MEILDNKFLEKQYEMLCDRMQPDSELEWQDLADLRTQQTGAVEHRDTVRKGAKLLYEYIDAGWIAKPTDNQSGNNSSDIDSKIRELQKERNKLAAEKIEASRIYRQTDRFELFYEKVAEAISNTTPMEIPERSINFGRNTKKEYLLTFADIHAGANFVSINNSYSMEECKRRFGVLLDYCIDYVQEKNINCLKIFGGGDDVQGILRISDLKLNESTVVAATVFVARAISEFLNELSAHVDIDYYHSPTSNHSQSRPLGTKASEIGSEDIEYIVGHYIKDVLAHNESVNVNLNFGSELIEIPIFNFNVAGMHGHQLKSLSNAISDLSSIHRKFFDYLIVAHFHSGKEDTIAEAASNDVEVLVCPSFVGSCPYSDKIMKGAKAACKIFVFDEVYGHIGTDKIILN